MQWKQMDWPVLWDPVNRTGVRAVPLSWAIDEHGVVRAVNPKPETIEEAFVNQTYPAPPREDSKPAPSLPELESRAGTAEGARALGDALLLSQQDAEKAIGAYRRAVQLDPQDGRNHFRLGVALRARFDSAASRPGDLQDSVNAWAAALSLDPNQYIWRRIQQYGPRLEKPYPFYDWVEEARREIRARGEEPYPLRVEPRGSEIAAPTKALAPSAPALPPDPERRVHHDPGPGGAFVDLEQAVVPPAVSPGKSVRLHLLIRPNRASHWNNEAEPLRVFLSLPEGWKADASMQESPLPPEATSDELRALEFEIAAPEGALSGKVRVPIQAFFYVCESRDGTCLYRRKDSEVEIEVVSPGS
jgi:tetratricopeptide (TPR) repeat protein